jgi:hypothetical protein
MLGNDSQFTLSLDRQEYNAGSPMYCSLNWTGSPNFNPVTLAFKVRGPRGRIDLILPPALAPDFGGNGLPGKGIVYAISLSDLQSTEPGKPPLVPGDTLSVSVAITPKVQSPLPLTITTEARIVETDVNPLPDCAYALLARKTDATGHSCEECASFAWTPEPDPIELVQPADFTTGFIRRRAVYTLMDVSRLKATKDDGPAYFVQKIASNGSTHFRPYEPR